MSAVRALNAGLLVGLTYVLVAFGLAIVHRTSGYFNMAQATMATVSAYAAYKVADKTGSLPLAAMAAMAAGALVSVIVHVTIINRPGVSLFGLFVLTISLSVILKEALRLTVNDGLPVALPEPVRRPAADFLVVGGLSGLWLFVLVILITLALRYWLELGRGGLALRAVAESREVASIFGVAAPRLDLITTSIAGAMAGIGGLTIALLFTFLNPYVGDGLLFKSLALILVFGDRNVTLLLIGGIGLGVAEAGSIYWVSSGLENMLSFAAIIVALVLRSVARGRASTRPAGQT